MKTFEGNLVAQKHEGGHCGCPVQRVHRLQAPRRLPWTACIRHGVREEDISVAWVPGAFEIPLIASKMAESGKYDAVICPGGGDPGQHQPLRLRVRGGVQGDRPGVSAERQVPVLFGVLTTDTIEQAIERAGTKAGNKGYDCALSAIEMVNLIREVEA